MKALFFIDFELFSDDLKRRISSYRLKIPANVPVIWTITNEASRKPDAKDGFYAGYDRIFTKPDIEASFETAKDETGLALMDYLKSSGITAGYIGGSTFYGCVLYGGLSMKSVGITPVIMTDLTDFNEIPEADHEEAKDDFTQSKIATINSSQVLTILLSNPPKPNLT